MCGGIYGSGTATAVRNFQISRGLTADGVIGPRRWTERGDAVGANLTPLVRSENGSVQGGEGCGEWCVAENHEARRFGEGEGPRWRREELLSVPMPAFAGESDPGWSA
ncbi:peptidoglycan-binding domain-containing protein [Streptomyces flaveolus]|uniref:peptidoglycan-binding domain-containing protein n=1 Tax=Streptomyces flaveolus TaxID=67297 RepID=UPI0033B34890